jgi:hypothetical protein
LFVNIYPSSGYLKMPPKKRARADTTGNAIASPTTACAQEDAPVAADKGTDEAAALLWGWFELNPPPYYSRAPEDEDDDDEEDEEEEEGEGAENASSDKPAQKNTGEPDPGSSDYRYVMSKTVMKLCSKYCLEAAKRDQDAFSMHVYNDFTAYGLQEVIEKQLNAFNELMKEKEPNAIRLWI